MLNLSQFNFFEVVITNFVMMGQTLLITGATGLVGKALVKQCLAEGYTVHYLTTRKSKIDSQKITKVSIGTHKIMPLISLVLKALKSFLI